MHHSEDLEREVIMSETGIPGMGQIYQLGHAEVENLFDGPVELTEKIDGSFFSFTVLSSGELRMRSKGQALCKDAPSSKMFSTVMAIVESKRDALTPGWIYRGEYLSKPKHNSLAYDQVPQGNVALFDIELAPGKHQSPASRFYEANRLGFSMAPVLFYGELVKGPDILPFILNLLERDSFLGGQKIEGVVIKNFNQFSHGHILMAKFVSPAFKEVHSQEWKKANPSKGDVVDQLIDRYRSEARWNKAVQHLRDDGLLDNSPRDIGPLMKEVALDVLKEEEQSIKDALFKLCWPKIQRGIAAGLPDWYKEKLAADSFEDKKGES